jgi:hypothetical protein
VRVGATVREERVQKWDRGAWNELGRLDGVGRGLLGTTEGERLMEVTIQRVFLRIV